MTLKKIFFILTAVVLFSCSKSVDDVISKSIQARGNDLSKIKTIVAECKMSTMGFEVPIKMFFSLPSKMRIEMSLMNRDVITVLDNKKGWVKNDTLVRDLNDDQIHELESQLESQVGMFIPRLFDYQKKGLKPELISKDKVQGKELYRIRIVLPDSTEEFHYIDANTYVTRRINSKSKIRGQFIDAETIFDNYKNVDGYILPHTILINSGGQTNAKMVFSSIKINSGLDDSYFVKPQNIVP